MIASAEQIEGLFDESADNENSKPAAVLRPPSGSNLNDIEAQTEQPANNPQQIDSSAVKNSENETESSAQKASLSVTLSGLWDDFEKAWNDPIWGETATERGLKKTLAFPLILTLACIWLALVLMYVFLCLLAEVLADCCEAGCDCS